MRSATRFERPAQQATEPRAKQETRSVLCHSLVVDSTERGCRHCSGEFEQLLLTSNKYFSEQQFSSIGIVRYCSQESDQSLVGPLFHFAQDATASGLLVTNQITVFVYGNVGIVGQIDQLEIH